MLLGFGGGFEENDVGGAGAAGEGEGFAVAGPIDVADLVGGEVGELFCGAAGEGLAPDVGDAAMSDGVVERLAVGREGRETSADHAFERADNWTSLDGGNDEVRTEAQIFWILPKIEDESAVGR